MKLKKETLIDETNIDLETVVNDCVYSTTEKVIGKWIDDKPLYRKVYKFNFTSGSTQRSTTDTQHLNASIFTKLKAISTSDPISEGYYLANNDKLIVMLNSSKQLYVNIGNNYPTTPCTVYVIVEYTKTTD